MVFCTEFVDGWWSCELLCRSCVCMYVYMYVCVCMYVCVYVCTHVRTYESRVQLQFKLEGAPEPDMAQDDRPAAV